MRLAGLVALELVLTAMGCSGPGPRSRASGPASTPASATTIREASATPVGITASDIALLAEASRAKEWNEPLALRIVKRIDELERQLKSAPFIAEPALSLPGTFSAPAVLQPPKKDATRPDAFEPDSPWSGASTLHVGQTQIRAIESTRDQDWVALPNTEGDGYFRLVASGPISVRAKTSPTEIDVECACDTRDPVVMAAVPKKEANGAAATFFKIAAKGPTTYSVSRLATEPAPLIGDTEVDANSTGFGGAVGTLDTEAYYQETGRRATKAELRQLQEALFGKASKWAAWPQILHSPLRGGVSASFGEVPPRRPGPLQRSVAIAEGSSTEVGYWTRSVWRGRRWVVVSAGRDVSYEPTPYAQMAEMVHRLGQSPAMPVPGSLKPVIYLYPPHEETVTVGLGFRGQLTSTSPVIGRATGCWTVTAKRDGTLTDATGRRRPYLFWEGLGGLPIFDLSQGAVVRGSAADAFLRTALAERGLNVSESAEFREFWVPRISASPWVLIHFGGVAYEGSVPLAVTPRPDTSIRVYMVAKPLDAPIAVAPQRLAPPPKRRGFTLVEWGGALWR